jgi:ATP P2X receptor
MERVWDEADYVVPPAENGAFFVTTNFIVTPNQTWGSCPEVSQVFSITSKQFIRTKISPMYTFLQKQ